MKKYVYSCIILISLWAGIAVAESFRGESTWINESGSILYIEDIDSEGKITGYYVNKNERFHCQNSPYPVTGWILDGTNTIAFTVKWENTSENCASITAWTGFFNDGFSKLTAPWQLVVNGTTSPSQIHTGTDTFTWISQKKSKSIKKE